MSDTAPEDFPIIDLNAVDDAPGKGLGETPIVDLNAVLGIPIEDVEIVAPSDDGVHNRIIEYKRPSEGKVKAAERRHPGAR